MHFYPRSPCGERQPSLYQLYDTYAFLSTLSLRRATRRSVKLFRQNYISIHALLAESDRRAFYGTAQHTYFYPRSPCGERRMSKKSPLMCFIFLSTLSLRRATRPPAPPKREFYISIHALLAESDLYYFVRLLCLLKFLSTLSLRRATSTTLTFPGFRMDFYPRSPCGERRSLG